MVIKKAKLLWGEGLYNPELAVFAAVATFGGRACIVYWLMQEQFVLLSLCFYTAMGQGQDLDGTYYVFK